MIEKGASVNLTDKSGDTPLHMAVYSARVPVVEMLISAGAFVNATNKKLDTPLHTIGKSQKLVVRSLKESWFWNIDDYDADCYSIATLLIQNGADLRARNKDGKTPLDLVANEKSKEQKFMRQLMSKFSLMFPFSLLRGLHLIHI